VNGLVSAYILVKLEAGKEGEIFTKIKKLNQIIEASSTYGAYDLLIKVQFEKIEELDRFIFDVLRRIPGVTDTVTMVASKSIV
jgi:DNA-binding Lrp family transcriptional regulator